MAIEIGLSGQRTYSLQSPVLPAAGFLGYGRSYPGLLEPQAFGALVTAPTPLHSSGPERGMFARLRGGFILPSLPRASLSAVLQEHAPVWSRLRVPVVLAALVRDAEDGTAMAIRLDHEESVSGVELHVPAGAGAAWVAAVLRAFRARCDLPVTTKLPLAEAEDLAQDAVAAGAAALVLGSPHVGSDPAGHVRGPVYGPATLAYTLDAVRAIAATVGVPVIASGGIYSAADAMACLRNGAAAVQLDGIILLDPTAAAAVARALAPRPA